MTKTELLKTAKPISFNTEMVKAILDGRKTVTRRVIKKWSGYNKEEQHLAGFWKDFNESDNKEYIKDYAYSSCWFTEKEYIKRTSKYQVDDVLYVKEQWSWCCVRHGYVVTKSNNDDWEGFPDESHAWKSSQSMPKAAARIFLKVTGVRVERLQDITSEQCDKEGCKEYGYSCITGELMPSKPIRFQITWNDTVKKQDLDQYGWEANPWVWVYEFERVEVE